MFACSNGDLVGGAITILKNMSSSMGRMTSHILWKKHVPNHQPVINGDIGEKHDKHGKTKKPTSTHISNVDGFTLPSCFGVSSVSSQTLAPV